MVLVNDKQNEQPDKLAYTIVFDPVMYYST